MFNFLSVLSRACVFFCFSINKLTGSLVGEPSVHIDVEKDAEQSSAVKKAEKGRKRTTSASESHPVSPVKRRRRLSSSIAVEEGAPEAKDMLFRFADFLLPTQMAIDDADVATLTASPETKGNGDVEEEGLFNY